MLLYFAQCLSHCEACKSLQQQQLYYLKYLLDYMYTIVCCNLYRCTIAVGFLIDSLLVLLTHDVRSMLKTIGTWHCTRDLCLAEYWTSTRWTRISGRNEWSRGGRNTRVCSGNVMTQQSAMWHLSSRVKIVLVTQILTYKSSDLCLSVCSCSSRVLHMYMYFSAR